MKALIYRYVRFRLFCLTTLLMLSGLLAQAPAIAQVLDLPKFTGASREVDHAADRMNEVVDRARNAAMAIEYQGGETMRKRIDEINQIVARTMADINRIREKGFADADALITQAIERSARHVEAIEKQMVIDLLKLIEQTECAFNRTILEAIPRMLGGLGKLLGTNQIEVSAPVLYEGEQEPWFCRKDSCLLKRTFDIKSPYAQTYYDIKNYLLNRLDAARDDTPRRTIVLTYTYIAQLAKGTTCFMRGAEAEYIADYTDYINKSRQWDIVPERRR